LEIENYRNYINLQNDGRCGRESRIYLNADIFLIGECNWKSKK